MSEDLESADLERLLCGGGDRKDRRNAVIRFHRNRNPDLRAIAAQACVVEAIIPFSALAKWYQVENSLEVKGLLLLAMAKANRNSSKNIIVEIMKNASPALLPYATAAFAMVTNSRRELLALLQLSYSRNASIAQSAIELAKMLVSDDDIDSMNFIALVAAEAGVETNR